MRDGTLGQVCRTEAEASDKCLFIGSFHPASGGRGGGVQSQCLAIAKLAITDSFEWLPFDATEQELDKPPIHKRMLRGLYRLRAVSEFVNEHRPSHSLIFTSCYPFSLLEKGLLGWLLRRRGVKVVYSYRSRLQSPLPRNLRWPLKLCDRAAVAHLVQSRLAAEALGAAGVDSRRLILMRNVVHLEGEEVVAPETEASANAVSLIYVGSLEPLKGVQVLLRAIALLQEAGTAVTLNVCGVGNQRQELETLAESLGIAEQIVWRGWLQKDELRKVMRRSQVLVLPSFSEGMPNAVLEAFAIRLPVIATSVGGTPELVENGLNGLLYEPDDHQALTQHLKALITNKEKRVGMGEAGFQTVRSDFGPEQAVRALRKAFGLDAPA